MDVLNAVLLKLTALVLAPFVDLPAQAALIVISVIAGVLAAAAFRYTSNQDALKRVADRVRASMLAMRLFKDDLRSVFRAQMSLFTASGLRLWYSLPPMVVLVIPFVFLLAQMAMWYEFRPLAPGEAALVEVALADASWDTAKIEMIAPDVVSIDAPPVYDPDSRKITWRIRPRAAALDNNPLMLAFAVDNDVVAEKQLVVDAAGGKDALLFVSPMRPSTNFWDRLLYPGEAAFDGDSPIQSISISYGTRVNTICGFEFPWWGTFFIVSILAALALKPVIKVQF